MRPETSRQFRHSRLGWFAVAVGRIEDPCTRPGVPLPDRRTVPRAAIDDRHAGFQFNAPISAIAVRIAENKFFEPSFSRIHVTDLSVKQNPRLLLPFFKTGASGVLFVVLVNPTLETLGGRLQQVFYNDNLVPDELPGSFDYAIPPQGVIRLSLPDSPSLERGYIRLNPADGDLAPTASVLLRLEDSGVPVVLATMEAVEMRDRFKTFIFSKPRIR